MRLSVTGITALMTSGLMSFIGLAVNYGFRADFTARWLKASAIGYVVLVPSLPLAVPATQRVVAKMFARRRP